ncbi:MAG: hypothetical protein Q7T68_01455 [Sphingopyxis sp.]|nr:hypothetical protein [Sphingopyxis sp.]
MSALLWVVAALIGALVAARLAIMATLLLLLAALLFALIRLRFLLILLVGIVSQFPSPCAAHAIMQRRPTNPSRTADVPQFVALSPGRGGSATSLANIRASPSF